MDKKIRSFRDLNIWKLGMEIVEDVYRLTKHFPADEIYGLTSQMRRAAVSMPANIAEGFARNYNKEYRQFLYVSISSCAELETHLEITQRLKYLREKETALLLEKTDHFSRMTMNLIKLITKDE